MFRDLSCSESLGPEAGCGPEQWQCLLFPRTLENKATPCCFNQTGAGMSGPGVGMHSTRCPAFGSTEPMLQTLWTSQNQCSGCGSSCGQSHISLTMFLEETFAQGKEKSHEMVTSQKDSTPPSLNCTTGETIWRGNQWRCIQDI